MLFCSRFSYAAIACLLLFSRTCTTCDAFSNNEVSSSKKRLLAQRTNKVLRKASTSEAGQRKPWEFFRFVRQSSRFIDILPRKTSKRSIQPGDVLWKPVDTNKIFDFAPLDDVVMGGASSSTFDGATGKWIGQVTDANNGGFIGVRSTPVVDLDMSKCKGIEVKLSALNNNQKSLRLKVVMRDSTEFNGIAWTTSKSLNGRSLRIAFDEQAPTIFAKTVESDPFKSDQVKSIQLVYSKFEYDGALNPTFVTGDFALQVEEIRAY